MSSFASQYEENLFNTRYKKGNEKHWNDMFKRVADYVGNTDKDRKEYYNMMTASEFIPSSPQLWNYGTQEKSGSSCFTGRLSDSLVGIWEADQAARDVFKSSGGIGFDLTLIRPRGAKIGYSPLPAVGVISVAQRLELTTGYITAGGRARGALMLQLDIEHPDAMEFIFAKRPIKNSIFNPLANANEDAYTLPLQNCNMSIRVSDEFINRLEKDENWVFSWSDENGRVFEVKTWEQLIKNMMPDPNDFKNVEYQKFFKFSFYPFVRGLAGNIKCRQVWDFIIDNAWNHADPGIVFSDLYERFNPCDKYGRILSNPCSEYLSIPGGSCLLGSINLLQVYDKDSGGVDYAKLEKITRKAIRYLNDSISKTVAPVDYINDITSKIRTIGLGHMAVGDLFIMMGIRYGSDHSVRLEEQIAATITAAAWEESFDLCANKNYPKCEYWQPGKMITIFNEYARMIEPVSASLSARYRKLAERTANGEQATNTTVTSVAPTGSIAQIAGFLMNLPEVSGGIEPNYTIDMFRKDNSGEKIVYNSLVQDWLDANPGKTEEELPDYFVFAVHRESKRTIKSEEHIKIQGAASRFTSMSVSKTINLPENCSREDVSNAYLMAWREGIKGTACYRDRSKPFQVLNLVEKKSDDTTENVAPIVQDVGKRPEWLPGWIRKTKVDLGTGQPENVYIIIGMKDGQPYETLIHSDKLRNVEPKVMEGIDGATRMTSLALRHGIPLKFVSQQLSRIEGQHMFSLPTKISQSLARFIDTAELFHEKCPACHKTDALIHTENCSKCKYCGFQKCG